MSWSPAVSIYRIGNFFYKHKVPLLPKFFTLLNRVIFATYIPSTATIGRNLTVGYFGLGIVIHTRTIIGDNCLVGQNVTIGRNIGDRSVPTIGNDVYIGAGSVVFGEIAIGDNVIIGSNSVINKDIPPNTTVAGNPFRIIKIDRREKYYELDRK